MRRLPMGLILIYSLTGALCRLKPDLPPTRPKAWSWAGRGEAPESWSVNKGEGRTVILEAGPRGPLEVRRAEGKTGNEGEEVRDGDTNKKGKIKS